MCLCLFLPVWILMDSFARPLLFTSVFYGQKMKIILNNKNKQSFCSFLFFFSRMAWTELPMLQLRSFVVFVSQRRRHGRRCRRHCLPHRRLHCARHSRFLRSADGTLSSSTYCVPSLLRPSEWGPWDLILAVDCIRCTSCYAD